MKSRITSALRGRCPQPYQGTRVKTPARISSAARRAATTAQPSSDNHQPLREFSETAFVLMVFSSFLYSTHNIARRLTMGRVVPKCLADLLHSLRRDPTDNHQRRRGKLFLVGQARHTGPSNLLRGSRGVGHDHARQIVWQATFA